MAIKIGSNVSSMISQRKLGEATGTLSKVYERLSSGQRINRASDDAAGLAIADSLNAKSKIYTQGIRNGNDGISLLNIADSAMAELTGIVTRIRELSEQAANGSYSNKQRQALDAEAQQLSKEFTRITQTTSFNGMKIFRGDLGNGLSLQLGEGTGGALNASIGGAVGTGRFNNVLISSADNAARETALGDLNGDGIADLLVAGGNTVAVRLGRGDGTFGTAAFYTTTETSSYAIALGDLNNDGILDMATSGMGNRITIRLGQGDGTFGSSVSYSIGTTVETVVLGDLNNDGILDMVTAGDSSDVSVRLGNGDGTFKDAQIHVYNLDSYPQEVELSDLNNDGILDMLVPGNYKTSVKLGLGDGTFGAENIFSTQHNYTAQLTVGDINGDGVQDLISAGNGFLEIRLGAGDGTFGAATTYTGNYVDTALGDFNGDGNLDLLAIGSNATIMFGTGNGSFANPVVYSTGNAVDLVIGDLNNNGVQDFIVVTNGTNNNLVFMAETVEGLGALETFSLKTVTDARQAMGLLDQTLNNLARQRGTIGASQSRVNVAISNLQSATENFKAAESRIRDTDIAADAVELVRTQILQQAASAVLAQANQAPALALQLLE